MSKTRKIKKLKKGGTEIRRTHQIRIKGVLRHLRDLKWTAHDGIEMEARSHDDLDHL